MEEKPATGRLRAYICGTVTLVLLGVAALTAYNTFVQDFSQNIFVIPHIANNLAVINSSRVLPSQTSSNPAPVITGHEVTDPESSVDSWLRARKKLLSDKRRPTLVFLFAYMRGGSSIMGEIFNTDRTAAMWYEPGDAFFAAYHGIHKENLPQTDLFYKNGTRRSLDTDELSALTQYYSSLLFCDLGQLPPEALSHNFLGESTAMDGFTRCMRQKKRVSIDKCADAISQVCSRKSVPVSIGHQCHLAINRTAIIKKENPNKSLESLVEIVQQDSDLPDELKKYALQFVQHEICRNKMRSDNAQCLDVALKRCHSSVLRVVQVNRMKMEDIEPLIAKHPDIRVIHYTRDPRGIALSRSKVHLKRSSSVTKEAKFLCDRMSEDLRQRKRIEQKYPGVFLSARYEDLVQDPVGFANKIYSFWGSHSAKEWAKFSSRTMHARGNGFGFGISVNNAEENAKKWKTLIPRQQILDIQSSCGQYLKDTGYPIIAWQ